MWRREKGLNQGASQESEGDLGKTFQAEDTEWSKVIDGKGLIGQGLTNCHKDVTFSVRWCHWRERHPIMTPTARCREASRAERGSQT